MFAACAAALLFAGCPSHTTHMAKPPANVPLQTATRADLLAKYNQIAGAIHSLNATVTMQVTSTTAYTGVIKQYHQVNGFILAQKPDSVRVIGQLPVIGTNIFDMVSDGKTFQMYIPSQHKFLTGPAKLEKPSDKPVENLRPQHLMDAIFWPTIPENEPVLFEQADDNGTGSYVLTVAMRGATASDLHIARKVWFERVGLTLSRLEIYGSDGQIESDIRYSGWSPFGDVNYPKDITLNRPADGYSFAITVTKLTPNQTIEAPRFVLAQPAGSDLVKVGEDTGSATK
jgi:hypothetical protein